MGIYFKGVMLYAFLKKLNNEQNVQELIAIGCNATTVATKYNSWIHKKYTIKNDCRKD